jgi:FtsZ-binding cell division protein ZapB
MWGAIIMCVIMAVPIAAIISNAVLKYKKLEYELNRPGGSLSEEEKNILVESIKRLKEDNDRLRQQQSALEQRLQALEQKQLGG